MDVFLSWSGRRSHQISLELRTWLPLVLQHLDPFVSSEEIRKGTRWFTEVSTKLDATHVGILCLVPENIVAPWLLFEAGALSKAVTHSRLIPLLFDVPPSALGGSPLSQFQATSFEREDMLRLMGTLNELLDDRGSQAGRLEAAFDVLWPKLDEAVSQIMSSAPPEPPLSDGPTEGLSAVEIEILEVLSGLHHMEGMDADDVGREVSIGNQKATYYLRKLAEDGYLDGMYGVGRPARYRLGQAGREELIRLNKL